MMIFRKAIPRRVFLRGMGATIALPLLDAMVPAFASVRDNLAVKPPLRWAFVNTPNGHIMEKWKPAREGPDFELTPIMQPLGPYRDRLLVLSGLSQKEAIALTGTEAGGEHPRASAAMLTCAHPKQTGGADLHVGTSIDQIIAKQIGKETALPSLELTLESNDYLGACENNYSCAYYNTLSWRDPTTPMPTESDPRVIFERLFGDATTDPAERLARIGRRRSILDFVSQRGTRLLKDLGTSDSTKMEQYLDAVREVERRIQASEEQGASVTVSPLSVPTSVPDTFEEHIQLIFDLMALAFQNDRVRIIVMMYGHEVGALTYPQLGAPDGFHSLTHHQGDPDKVAKCIKIETYNTKMFAYLLEKLQAAQESDGSLLDHMIVHFGPSLGDGNLHLHTDIPVTLIGGRNYFKGGRHIRCSDTPMANLYLNIADKFGVHLESFGDSTGRLDLS